MIVSCSLVFVCSLCRQGGEGESMSGHVSSFLDTMVSTSRGGIHSSIHSYINLTNSGAGEVTDQVLLYKPGDLSSTPGAHIKAEGENQLYGTVV